MAETHWVSSAGLDRKDMGVGCDRIWLENPSDEIRADACMENISRGFDELEVCYSCLDGAWLYSEVCLR